VTNLSASSDKVVELTSSDTVSVPTVGAREEGSELYKAVVTAMSDSIAMVSKQTGGVSTLARLTLVPHGLVEVLHLLVRFNAEERGEERRGGRVGQRSGGRVGVKGREERGGQRGEERDYMRGKRREKRREE
jgi:hypothetical protein